MPQLSSRQKKLIAALKIAAAAAILVILLRRIQGESGFHRLANEPKHWLPLALAQGLVLLAFSLSFVRWFMLVRGLDLAFRIKDAFRLGTLGFMLNQVAPGSVGGDLVKAVFIAREQSGKRTEAIATVLVDRVIGLYAMLVIASLGLALAGNQIQSRELLRSLQFTVWPAALAGTVGLAFVLSPFATGPHARKLAGNLPLIGHTFTRLLEAADVYRSRRVYLFAGFAIALLTHCMLISAFWLIGLGLPVQEPSFTQNATLVPIGLVAGAVIPTPGGLGGLEATMEWLYSSVGSGKGDGTIVALAYRAMTYLFAAAGAFYYFTARKNVGELIHEAEVLAEETD